MMQTIAEDNTDSIVPDSIVDVLLESLTPVDQSVLRNLAPEVVRQHVQDLYKRLSVAAEITAPGRGAGLVDQLLTEEPASERMLSGLDGILEFGQLPERLSDADRAKADRGEIRQEVVHFDRIMDLESLTEGRLSLKARRDMVYERGLMGAVERLLVLVHERLVLASNRPMQWQDLTAVPQGLIEPSAAGTRLRRTLFPVIAAVAATGDQAVLAELERYLVRHPVPVALGLLDYSILLESNTPVAVAAMALSRTESGEIQAEIWSAGAASWVLLDREGHEQRVLRRGVLVGRAAGGNRTGRAAVDIIVPSSSWLLISLDNGRLAQLPDLEVELNRPGRSGRIDLSVALPKLLGEYPYVVAKGSDARTLSAPRVEDTDADMLSLAMELLGDVAGLRLSIECGHIHADREVGPAQLRGLEVGARFAGFLRSEAADGGRELHVDVTPMVDDDHVLNRFAFASYRELFRQRDLAIDDLILESSPLTRAIAHDVLRRAVQRDGQGFDLVTVGSNLYLEAERLRLELIEDLTGEMRNGCVLFEVGLVMYRAAREAVTDVFWSETGVEPFDLHGRMAADYDAAPDPVARAQRRTDYERLYPDPWFTVRQTAVRTPFLDAYSTCLADRADRGVRTVVFNVLEDYYRPQQEKVVRLAELLAIPLPLSAVFFSPHGRGVEVFHSPEVLR